MTDQITGAKSFVPDILTVPTGRNHSLELIIPLTDSLSKRPSLLCRLSDPSILMNTVYNYQLNETFLHLIKGNVQNKQQHT